MTVPLVTSVPAKVMVAMAVVIAALAAVTVSMVVVVSALAPVTVSVAVAISAQTAVILALATVIPSMMSHIMSFFVVSGPASTLMNTMIIGKDWCISGHCQVIQSLSDGIY